MNVGHECFFTLGGYLFFYMPLRFFSPLNGGIVTLSIGVLSKEVNQIASEPVSLVISSQINPSFGFLGRDRFLGPSCPLHLSKSRIRPPVPCGIGHLSAWPSVKFPTFQPPNGVSIGCKSLYLPHCFVPHDSVQQAAQRWPLLVNPPWAHPQMSFFKSRDPHPGSQSWICTAVGI